MSSVSRCQPLVSSRLPNRAASSLVGTTPVVARLLAFLTTGVASAKTGPDASPALPRLFSATVVASENGVSVRVASVNEGAATPRVSSSGVPASENSFRLAIVVRNSRRKVGNFCSAASSSGPWAAVAWAASPEWAKKPTTCSFSRVSGVRIASESTASWASWSFCSVSVLNSLSTSRRVGLARLIVSSRSSPRPARPAPSSLKISRKRCA